MNSQRPWMTVLIGVLLCGFWLIGCSQQEGPAEQAGKKLDEVIEQVGDTMEETKENIVDTAEDLADEVKEIAE